MSNKPRALSSGYPKRASSASPMLIGAAWQNASKAIEGCGHLQRLILEYGKHFPHSVMSPACLKSPLGPCLHFSYGDTVRPLSGVSSVTIPLFDSGGESDAEVVDEMTLTFPRKGDMIDYIQELKLNTRRSTPLHWLDPEDKIAIHDINSKLKKAFKESLLQSCPPRSFSAAPVVPDNDNFRADATNNEIENLTVRIPKRLLTPSSGHPTPRLSVEPFEPCATCARRQAQASARRISISNSPMLLNVIESCDGPLAPSPRSTICYHGHRHKTTVLSPSASPRDPGKLVYFDFVHSYDKMRLLKEAATMKRLEREKEVAEGRFAKATAVEITMPDLIDHDGDDIFDDAISLEAVEPPCSPATDKGQHHETISLSPSLPSSRRSSVDSGHESKTRKVLSKIPQRRMSDQRQKQNVVAKPVQSQSPVRRTESQKRSSRGSGSKSPVSRRSPVTGRKSSPAKHEGGRAIVSILKRPNSSMPQSKPPPSVVSTTSSNTTSKSSSKKRSISAGGKRSPSARLRPGTATAVQFDMNKKLSPSTESPAAKDEAVPPIVPVEAFANKSLRERTSSFGASAGPVTEAAMSTDIDDMPNSGDVAKLKAQLTNAAEPMLPLNAAVDTLVQGGDGESNNSGRLSPPLVHPADVDPATVFQTLDEIEAINNQGLESNTPTEAAKPTSPTRKVATPGSAQIVKILRPPPLPVRKKQPIKLESSDEPVTQAAIIQAVEDKVQTAVEPSITASVASSPSPSATIKVNVKEKRSRRHRDGSESALRRRQILYGGEEDDADDSFDSDDDEIATFDSIETESENKDEKVNALELYSDSDEILVEDDDIEVEINEEDEKWWKWTQRAAQLAVDIDQLRNRFYNRQPKPPASRAVSTMSLFRRQKTAPQKQPAKDPRAQFVEELSEKSRLQVMGKEQERCTFLTNLREVRSEIRMVENDYKKNAREIAMRIRMIRRELDSVTRHEHSLATRYYAKRDRDRTNREKRRNSKGTQLKAEASARCAQTSTDEHKTDLLRDEALLISDDETRDAELVWIDNLLIEYEEQKRLTLEKKWGEIDKLMDQEEDEHQRMEVVEEDLLLGDIRSQLTTLQEQIDSERGVMKATQLIAEKKVSALRLREDEMVKHRVDMERQIATELASMHDQLSRIFLDEEHAKSAANEESEESRRQRQKTILKLRQQREHLETEIGLSPAFVYSYFRLLERVPSDAFLLKKKGERDTFRRPNTAFKK